MQDYIRFETMRKGALVVASGAFVLGLFYAAGTVTYAGTVANELMLVNAKTGKCLTIAGGVSTNNNVLALQFSCDTDLSRRWTIRLKL
jgi:cytolethal distending toxin subunit A